VYLVIGSGQGEHTKAQLIEILTTMDFQISENQTLMIKSPRSKISTEGKFTDQKAEVQFKNFCQQIKQ
jgi:hypothetical protein